MNNKLYQAKKELYPIEVITEGKRLSPKHFQNDYPQLWFVCIPMMGKQHWLFKSDKEKSMFLAWQSKIQNQWRTK